MADYAALQEQNKLAALRTMAEGNPDPYAGGTGVISGSRAGGVEPLHRRRRRPGRAGRVDQPRRADDPRSRRRRPQRLGESGEAYAKNLAALQAEAANAAANPASVPQVDYTSASGRQPTKAEQQAAAGYKQYGGYNTAAEEENAVLGRAMQIRDERANQAETERVAAGEPSTESGIAAVKALQAKNEAIVGGPGAVIHGIAYNDPSRCSGRTSARFPEVAGRG